MDKKLQECLQGKTIESVEIVDSIGRTVILHFTDGSLFEIYTPGVYDMSFGYREENLESSPLIDLEK